MQGVKSFEIDVAPIHHIDGSGVRKEDIEHIHVVEFSVRKMNEFRDITTKIEQGM